MLRLPYFPLFPTPPHTLSPPAVNERWQLAPADMALLAAHLPFPVGDAPESEDREVALLRALEKCGTQLFPSDRVQVRRGAGWEAAGWVGEG